MYPFYDENYFSNSAMPMQGMRAASPMRAMAPMQSMQPFQHAPSLYGNMHQPFQQMASGSSLRKFMGSLSGTGGFNLRNTLNGATKTIGTINQVIPLVNQARPVFHNARNAMRIMKAVKQVNRLDAGDLKEIDDAVTVTEETIKDADIVEKNDKATTNNEQKFENML